MSRRRITRSEDSASFSLPREMLDSLGVGEGDEVDVSIIDRTLIVRPLDEAERAERLEAATRAVLERRRGAYAELAKGVE